MLETLEVRWFFAEQPADRALFIPKELQPQRLEDWYAAPGNPGCGVKLRDRSIDTKLLVEPGEKWSAAGAEGILQRWRKWTAPIDTQDPAPDTAALRASGWVLVQKQRWLRFFVPAGEAHRVKEISADELSQHESSCQFEWSQAQINGSTFWSVCLEATGPAAEAGMLAAAMKTAAPEHKPPLPCRRENSLSYPGHLLHLPPAGV